MSTDEAEKPAPASTPPKPVNKGGRPKGSRNRQQSPNEMVLKALKIRGGTEFFAKSVDDKTLAQLAARLFEKDMEVEDAKRGHEDWLDRMLATE